MSGKVYVGRRRSSLWGSTSSLGPECQSLISTLKPLGGDDAATALISSVSSIKDDSKSKLFKANLKANVEKLRKRGWDRGYKTVHEELGMAADQAFRASFPPDESSGPSGRNKVNTLLRSSTVFTAQSALASLPNPQTPGADLGPSATSTPTVASTMVSDSEGEAASTLVDSSVELADRSQEHLVRANFWRSLLEAVRLQLVAGGHGANKYSIHQLAGPVMSTNSYDQVRHRISRTFLSIYSGSTSKNNHCECRVYTVERGGKVWIQVNLGQPGDSVLGHDTFAAGNSEFRVVLVPDSPLIALSCSKPARSLTRFVLSALEHTLTCSVITGDEEAPGFSDLKGSDPHTLLKAAQDIEANQAVGRHRTRATNGKRVDPVTELQDAATSSLLCRKQDQRRLSHGDEHGRHVAQRAAQVEHASKGRASLVGESNLVSVVDHDMDKRNSRKRTRESALGQLGDCPVRTTVRWNFEGKTRAASMCCEHSDSRKAASLTKLKCKLTMKGSDVFGGLHELVEAGFMTTIPHHIQEAPSLGTTINVDEDGTVRSGDNLPHGRR